ncbi:alanine racemase [Micrococcoides hystricis]|uniref:Alanine racemase n=1 Tax=Micrococcoides hystricis TaxID=1572761 RepID=A0ABV6PB05_9MICC
MSVRFPEVNTPATLVDRQRLQRNIDAMAEYARAHELRLRPHAKTHKIVEITRIQLQAGAVGLSVATLGEAKVFVESGVEDIFVAYPVWASQEQAAELLRLANKARLSIGADSVEAIHNLAQRIPEQRERIGILIEVNSGHNRSGRMPPDVVPVAQAVVDAGFSFRGVFTFPGHSYGPDQAKPAVSDEEQALASAKEALVAAGIPTEVLSGGSSPTATLMHGGVVTEMRPGVYVFGDAQQLELDRIGWDDIALTILTTVVSRDDGSSGSTRRIVVDAGSKVMGGDRPAWTTGFGRVMGEPDARITALSEHHGTIIWPEEQDLPEIGSRLQVIPNHVCVAVNLVDYLYVTDGNEPLEKWQVAARGLNC